MTLAEWYRNEKDFFFIWMKMKCFRLLTSILIAPMQCKTIGGQIELFYVIRQINIVPLFPCCQCRTFGWLLFMQCNTCYSWNIVEKLNQIQCQIIVKFIFGRCHFNTSRSWWHHFYRFDFLFFGLLLFDYYLAVTDSNGFGKIQFVQPSA